MQFQVATFVYDPFKPPPQQSQIYGSSNSTRVCLRLFGAPLVYLRCSWCTRRLLYDPFTSNVSFATVWCTRPLNRFQTSSIWSTSYTSLKVARDERSEKSQFSLAVKIIRQFSQSAQLSASFPTNFFCIEKLNFSSNSAKLMLKSFTIFAGLYSRLVSLETQIYS